MNREQWIMRDRYEQADCYSEQEYKRRWDVARRIMAEHDADVLLVLDAAREGHETWFTGRKNVETVIVPREGDILAVLCREFDERIIPFCPEKADYSRYVKQKAPYVEYPGLKYINYPGPADCAKLIARYAPKRLGIVNARLLGHELKAALDELLPGLETVDLKQELDSQKTVKSPEEWVALRYAAKTLEQIHDILPYVIRPGVHMGDAVQALKNAALDLGGNGDLHIMLVPTGPMDQPPPKRKLALRDGRAKPDRGPTLEMGDSFFTIIECGGYGGHQLAMGRIGTLGPASDTFREAVRQAGMYNSFAASQMKPGNTLGNIVRATENLAKEHGTSLRRMCWMHGLSNQGYYEQFAVNDYGMEWPLTEGALLHCHPNYLRKYPDYPGETSEMMLLNSYIVTPDGGRSLFDLEKYPLEVMEIDC